MRQDGGRVKECEGRKSRESENWSVGENYQSNLLYYYQTVISKCLTLYEIFVIVELDSSFLFFSPLCFNTCIKSGQVIDGRF